MELLLHRQFVFVTFHHFTVQEEVSLGPVVDGEGKFNLNNMWSFQCFLWPPEAVSGLSWEEIRTANELLGLLIMQIYLLFRSMICLTVQQSLCSVLWAPQPSFIRHSRAVGHFCRTKKQHVCRCLSASSNHCDKDSAIGSFWKADIFIALLHGTALLFFFNNTRHAARATGWNHSNQGCFSKDSALVHGACSLPGGLPGHLHILTVNI